MDITFWGVRGSIPVSGDRFHRTGGNTTCVSVEHQGHTLILDGGTGLRSLGAHLGFRAIKATLLFTHVHWDHIQGVPFFTPAFHPGSELLLAGADRDSGKLADALAAQMKPPQFPITLAALQARLSWLDLQSNKSFDDGPFTITPLDMKHPDGVFPQMPDRYLAASSARGAPSSSRRIRSMAAASTATWFASARGRTCWSTTPSTPRRSTGVRRAPRARDGVTAPGLRLSRSVAVPA